MNHNHNDFFPWKLLHCWYFNWIPKFLLNFSEDLPVNYLLNYTLFRVFNKECIFLKNSWRFLVQVKTFYLLNSMNSLPLSQFSLIEDDIPWCFPLHLPKKNDVQNWSWTCLLLRLKVCFQVETGSMEMERNIYWWSCFLSCGTRHKGNQSIVFFSFKRSFKEKSDFLFVVRLSDMLNTSRTAVLI